MTTDGNTDDNTPTRCDRIALAWFALGTLVGAVTTVGTLTLSGAVRPAAVVDLGAVREAARQGVQEVLRPGDQSTANAAKAVRPAPDTHSVTIRESNTQGQGDAPVTIVEYGDFQCPFCQRFQQQVYPKIVDQYVKTGMVRFSYKHFAFLGDESRWAAQAAECAADQKRFWDYHDLLFAKQVDENVGTFIKDKLITYAGELKMDTTTFTACLNGDKTVDRVKADTDEGQQVGVRGTPSFLINGKPLVGAQPFEAFQTAIEEALKVK